MSMRSAHPEILKRFKSTQPTSGYLSEESSSYRTETVSEKRSPAFSGFID